MGPLHTESCLMEVEAMSPGTVCGLCPAGPVNRAKPGTPRGRAWRAWLPRPWTPHDVGALHSGCWGKPAPTRRLKPRGFVLLWFRRLQAQSLSCWLEWGCRRPLRKPTAASAFPAAAAWSRGASLYLPRASPGRCPGPRHIASFCGHISLCCALTDARDGCSRAICPSWCSRHSAHLQKSPCHSW